MISTMTQPPEPGAFTHRSLSPHKGANDVATNERFPSFDDTSPNFHLSPSAVVSESPLEIAPGQLPTQDFKWPPRKMSQRLRDARPSGVYTHRPRRSVTDAIHKFRTRQGSVSENAQELAEALKAPISYKLIVNTSEAGCCQR